MATVGRTDTQVDTRPETSEQWLVVTRLHSSGAVEDAPPTWRRGREARRRARRGPTVPGATPQRVCPERVGRADRADGHPGVLSEVRDGVERDPGARGRTERKQQPTREAPAPGLDERQRERRGYRLQGEGRPQPGDERRVALVCEPIDLDAEGLTTPRSPYGGRADRPRRRRGPPRGADDPDPGRPRLTDLAAMMCPARGCSSVG